MRRRLLESRELLTQSLDFCLVLTHQFADGRNGVIAAVSDANVEVFHVAHSHSVAVAASNLSRQRAFHVGVGNGFPRFVVGLVFRLQIHFRNSASANAFSHLVIAIFDDVVLIN